MSTDDLLLRVEPRSVDVDLASITALSSGVRLLLLFSAGLACVPYVRHVVAKARPGLTRLATVLPLVVCFVSSAAAFDSAGEVLEKTVAMFVFGWLASFKLLSFCLNRGPLVGPWTTAQLAAILCLPVYPMPPQDKKEPAQLSGRLKDHAGQSHDLLLRWSIKLVVFGGVVYVLLMARLHPVVRDFFQALGLYCFVCLLMDGPGSVVTHMLSFNIIPTFDQPWLSTSMADFWGRRWNIPTSHLLRVLVYDPIVEGRLVKDSAGKRVRQSAVLRALGMCATFFTSAIVHEIILWACQPDGRITWKWTMFFTIQGPLMVAENIVVRWCRRQGWVLNPWVSRALTVPFMLTIGHWLFFAAVNDDTDLAERVVHASSELLQPAIAAVKTLLLRQ